LCQIGGPFFSRQTTPLQDGFSSDSATPGGIGDGDLWVAAEGWGQAVVIALEGESPQSSAPSFGRRPGWRADPNGLRGNRVGTRAARTPRTACPRFVGASSDPPRPETGNGQPGRDEKFVVVLQWPGAVFFLGQGRACGGVFPRAGWSRHLLPDPTHGGRRSSARSLREAGCARRWPRGPGSAASLRRNPAPRNGRVRKRSAGVAGSV